jgi:CRP-like cAMP-binding protein
VKAATPAPANSTPDPGLALGSLRRTKLFAGLDEPQLASLVDYLELIRFPQFSHIVRQGQHGDAMYVVSEGEVRVLSIVEGKESILATLTAGDCFGEISLLDQGPRSADVIANKDSVLVRISKAAFDRLVREAPALAVPFLLALSRAVVQRVRRTNLKYEDSIRFIRASTAQR